RGQRQLAARALELLLRQRAPGAREDRGAGHVHRSLGPEASPGQSQRTGFSLRQRSGILARLMDSVRSRPQVSVVVPAYNEIQSLPVLLRELRDALAAANRTWELLLVDDGSRDGTGDAMEAAARGEPRIRVLRLEQNVGQSAALAAGLVRA